MGYKVKSGINTKEPCLHISVTKKLNLDELRPLDVIPKTFLGIKTDIVEDEELKNFSGDGTSTMGANILNLNSKIRPV